MRNKLLFVVILLLIAYIGLNYYRLYMENIELMNKVGELNYRIDLLEKQLSYYMSISRYYQGSITIPSGEFVIKSATFHAVAVAVEGDEYIGVILNITLTLIPGEGRLLVNTQPRIGIDLQSSLRIAKEVAEAYTGIDLDNVDIVLSISAPMEVDVVDGPSAGAVITATLISLILGREMNTSIYVTGTINPDGSIGRVGGIIEKAIAIAEAGGDILIVPPGQSNITLYIPVRRQIIPGIYIVTYEVKTINVEEYLREEGYTLRIIEVYYIDELMKYILIED